MLHLCKTKTKHLIYDVNKVFANLNYDQVKPYLSDLINLKVIKRLVGIPEKEQKVFQIGCETDFGNTTLDNISMSVKIIILSKICIKKHKYACFVSSLIGDNYLAVLEEVCKDTNYISLYTPTGLLVQNNYEHKSLLERRSYETDFRN